jgi:hypothetical protein
MCVFLVRENSIILTMKKFDAVALGNTLAISSLVLHPLFHLWGWLSPRTYEVLFSEFVIGLHLKVEEHFHPKFFIFYIVEAVTLWIVGFVFASLYNKLSK